MNSVFKDSPVAKDYKTDFFKKTGELVLSILIRNVFFVGFF